ncbi:flavin-dependent oxidoreductase [Brevibacillus choshinensis]|uniref:Flavin-dependent oxidoreductase n=1 Tax=Brevibacillus choshinensis TaxID=54911 RepID=A0ABX7FWZ5_BRECH|nr:flavin-dependent oxidoreductase [Brevibacillus choshinensis]QRG70323.1 flavin-dependent oxidoreductase [Brevibacillus choshinensis]
MMNVKKVMIIGGGIGGLVTALHLAQSEISVQIFESVEEIRELGVGINLLPHAVRVLANLGLIEELEKVGLPTAELIYHNKYGQRIWAEPRGIAAGYRWPQYSLLRGKLQMLFLQSVKDRLGEKAVVTGHHLAAFQTGEHGVEASFVNRKTGALLGTRQADILIGADGIHSAVRRSLYPNEGIPKFSGRMLWRGITRADSFLTGRSMIMAGHQDQKFVAYPACPLTASHGASLINWIAELRVGGDAPPRNDWNRLADKRDFAPAFSNWRFDWLDVEKLIQQTSLVYEFPMVDRDPLPRWSFGRVTLLGDAAHPMYPIGSNGASQAILDAEALGQALARNPDAISALAQYEEVRMKPTAAIVQSNREMGPEKVMQIVEERAPHGFAKLEDVIARTELEQISTQYKRLAGFDPDLLNKHGAFDRGGVSET